MTPEQKLEAIKKILPEKTSTIEQDISYVNLVKYLKTVIYGKETKLNFHPLSITLRSDGSIEKKIEG